MKDVVPLWNHILLCYTLSEKYRPLYSLGETHTWWFLGVVFAEPVNKKTPKIILNSTVCPLFFTFIVYPSTER